MLKLTQDDVKKIESFMINKTRDLELALYNCLIDGDDNLMVSYALSMYQNGDGGFGHGLEPDNTCPSSSTIATEYALSLLRRIGYDKSNLDEMTKTMVNRAFKYIFSQETDGNYLYPVSPDVNQYPHAPWWSYSDDCARNWKNNPGASLYAMALHFLNSKTKFYSLALNRLKTCIDEYLEEDDCSRHVVVLYEKVYEILTNEKINYKNQELFEKISKDIKRLISPKEEWRKDYPTYPFDLITSDLYLTNDLQELFEESLDFLIESRTKIGVWDITWKWNNEYEDEYEVARIKWMGILAVNYLEILKKNGRVL